MNFHRRCILGASFALALGLAPLAQAQAPAGKWPERPIRLIVNFPAGGGTDAIARSMADSLSKALGQSVVVENRVGAAGNIGLDAVARAAPDGYTLLHSSDGPIVINPHIFKQAQVATEMVAVAPTAGSPMLLLVRPDVPGSGNLKDFLAYLRANPGKLTYGSAGPGTLQHVAVEAIANAANFDALHVPYKGSQAILTDMLGGRVDFTVDLGAAVPFIKSGQLKLLAVAGPRRSALFPDVPTLKEQGVDIAMSWISGIYAPRGTPPAVVTRLNQEISRIMQAPETKASLAAMAAESLVSMSPEEFMRHQQRSRADYGEVLRRAGIKGE
jgi:tripartite-type tricarboxylate transporter receptor subunit TctC